MHTASIRPVYGSVLVSCFFFNDTATTEIYTLSLHDALPIYAGAPGAAAPLLAICGERRALEISAVGDGHDHLFVGDQVFQYRKGTRLNSSPQIISYAVFCLQK